MIKNIIFDLDGTITNSYEGIVKGVKYSLDKINFKYEEQNLVSFIGPPLQDSYMNLGFSKEESDDLIKDFRDYYLTKGISEMSLYDGIVETIEKFYNDGFKIFLATSKVESSAKRILKDNDLIQYFSFVAGATMDQSRVEKADVIRYLIENTGIITDESVMIGDRHHDIEGAYKNEIKAIAAEYGFGSREEFGKAIFVAETPMEIYDFVKKFNGR